MRRTAEFYPSERLIDMNFIVAVDQKWGIGKNNDLLFSIKGDMKHFKEITTGKTVVMGDRTLLSLPGSKPLKNRRNIVMTLDETFSAEGVEICHSVEDLAKLLGDETRDVFVIGGATIYNLLMDYCSYAYITKVDADGDAQVFIRDLDTQSNWSIAEKGETFSENGLNYTFLTYENCQIKPL